ncbi:MAG: trehalose-phosphatase [Labilithrix sp.]|nr:trehalose-phosphatase [Labilithrix sp.]MCW5817987.1 trehalose-phosphatase [Labilithrix sp.]
MSTDSRARTEHWLALARHTPLGILCDLDGTLVPFARTPDEARPDDAAIDLVTSLALLPGVTMAIVSGRPRAWLETFFTRAEVFLVAEHGASRRGMGAWDNVGSIDPAPLEDLAFRLEALARKNPGALLERKQTTVAIHYRQVPRGRRGELLVEAYGIIDAFVAKHPSFERLEGVLVVEIRPASVKKSSAVPWIRGIAGAGTRLLTLGDDVTDEHMFRAVDANDESVVVRTAERRRTAARWELDDADEVRAVLQWIRGVRAGETPLPLVLPRQIEQPAPPASGVSRDLLVVSNRLPDFSPIEGDDPAARKKNVGGLVSALEPALRERRAMWLGWSGKTVATTEPTTGGTSDENEGPVQLAWVDYTEKQYRDYYSGFCNGTLWPLFHSFPSRVAIEDAGWESYRDVHEAFADVAAPLTSKTAKIWAHDYHLMLFAQVMRQRGHVGPMGHFLHIPFPSLDMLSMLPWAAQLLDALLDFDLLGFHTPKDVTNFMACVSGLLSAQVSDAVVRHRNRETQVAAMPIGIIPDAFQETPEPAVVEEIDGLMRVLGDSKLVLGVDRLDYTKGIPERLLGFGKLLEMFPEWRGNVSLVQVSVPSRADVPLYAEQRATIEAIVGRLNGEYGEAAWVPVRYLYRSYAKPQLAQLYRAAAVGYVTPLRDGMNLVAKEYVAAQDPENPGVLMLSRFAGAAVEMQDAVLTNPYYLEGMARDLDRALRMQLDERKTRHGKLLATVQRSNAVQWAEGFLAALASCR